MKRIMVLVLTVVMMVCFSSCAVAEHLFKAETLTGKQTTVTTASVPTIAPTAAPTTAAPTTTAETTTTAASTTSAAGLFTVRLDAENRIYSGPDFDYAVVGTLGQSTVYTIVEEVYNGDYRWGKLKSGLGWVCLSMPYGDYSSEYYTVNYTIHLEEGTPIYKGPVPGEQVGTITQSTMYTIVEECYNNAGSFGRLKSGLGWVELGS